MTPELALTDTGFGPAVVLLHAFPCNRTMWDSQIGALAVAGFRVLAPDLPGFGDSAPSEATPDLAASAQAVFDLIDDRALGQVTLAGLCMGGYVAMEMLRQQPGRIGALGLIDTKSTADDEPARTGRLEIAEKVEAENSTAALSGMIGKLLGDTTRANRPEVVERTKAFIGSASPRAVAWAQRAMAKRPDSAATLAAFDGPALVAYGEEDTLSPPTDQTAMIDALPNVTVHPIAACGHLSALEQPEEVSAALIALGRKA